MKLLILILPYLIMIGFIATNSFTKFVFTNSTIDIQILSRFIGEATILANAEVSGGENKHIHNFKFLSHFIQSKHDPTIRQVSSYNHKLHFQEQNIAQTADVEACPPDLVSIFQNELSGPVNSLLRRIAMP